MEANVSTMRRLLDLAVVAVACDSGRRTPTPTLAECVANCVAYALRKMLRWNVRAQHLAFPEPGT